jgi:hypothetical protein
MNGSMCAAIRGRAVIQFYYGGGLRTAEPYCHGTSHAGNEVLRAYQTGGFSESGNPIGWKLFEVGEISIIRQTGATFSTNRSGYNPNDSHMMSIHCRV